MPALEVIEESAAAAIALEPIRARLLAELSAPVSAAALGDRLGIGRQRLNYHMRALETHGLVRVAETRRWGGITERLMVASAEGYLISPAALGPAAADRPRSVPPLSAAYLVALAGRAVREVGRLLRGASTAAQSVATLAVDAEVRFATPGARADFTRDLTAAIADLVSRYHDPTAPAGRRHRLVVLAHPLPPPESTGLEPAV